MVPLGLTLIWLGGTVWLAGLTTLGAGSAFEWVRLCRHRPLLASAGILYVGVAVAALVVLRSSPVGLANVAFLMAVVWAGDIGAYGAGRLVGGRRLWPALSPGKTWSGAIGGLLTSAAAGLAVARLFGGVGHALALALALGAVAQTGDLLESGLKRLAGAKDSSGLIPGHGGLLDRLDGLLAASPVACGVWLLGHRGAFLWA